MKNDRYSGKIKLEFFGKVQEYFKIYRDNKQELDHRIIDNNRWYKSRYNSDPDAGDTGANNTLLIQCYCK